MKTLHDYKNCYRLLDIDKDCTWKDLKKAYRILIKKWHPDQYGETKNKSHATEKLKEINAAYKQLKSYYYKFGTLPKFLLSRATIPVSVINHKKQDKYSAKNKKQPNYTSDLKKKNIAVRIALTLILFIIMYQYFDSLILKPSNISMPRDRLISEKSIKNNDTSRNTSISKGTKYFTHGSTIAEVALIQGPPDKIIENVWFYGKSEVYFKDGRVIDWLRISGNPINARIEIESKL